MAKKIEITFLKSAIPVGYAYGKGESGKFDAKVAQTLMNDGFAIPLQAEDNELQATLENTSHTSEVNAKEAINLINQIEDFEQLKEFTVGEERKSVQEAAATRAAEIK